MTSPHPADPAGRVDRVGRLAKEAHRLEALAHDLRGSPHGDEPDLWAAGEALRCAAALLRSRAPTVPTQQVPALLHDAVALARSSVEATKFALRESS